MMGKRFTWLTLMLLGMSWSLVGCGPPAAVEDNTPVPEEEIQENEEMGDIDAIDEGMPEEGAEGEPPPA